MTDDSGWAKAAAKKQAIVQRSRVALWWGAMVKVLLTAEHSGERCVAAVAECNVEASNACDW